MSESFDTRIARLERELLDNATGPVLLLPEHNAAQCLAEYLERYGVPPYVVIYQPTDAGQAALDGLDFGGPVVLLPDNGRGS